MFTIKIAERVFDQHPTFCRGVVIASQLHNRGPDRDLEAQLQQACEEAAHNPANLSGDERVLTWIRAFEAFTDPKKFLPAHAALLKRVQRPGGTLPFISKAVCVMNLAAIKH